MQKAKQSLIHEACARLWRFYLKSRGILYFYPTFSIGLSRGSCVRRFSFLPLRESLYLVRLYLPEGGRFKRSQPHLLLVENKIYWKRSTSSMQYHSTLNIDVTSFSTLADASSDWPGCPLPSSGRRRVPSSGFSLSPTAKRSRHAPSPVWLNSPLTTDSQMWIYITVCQWQKKDEVSATALRVEQHPPCQIILGNWRAGFSPGSSCLSASPSKTSAASDTRVRVIHYQVWVWFVGEGNMTRKIIRIQNVE